MNTMKLRNIRMLFVLLAVMTETIETSKIRESAGGERTQILEYRQHSAETIS